jgi:hypothetical protein
MDASVARLVAESDVLGVRVSLFRGVTLDLVLHGHEPSSEGFVRWPATLVDDPGAWVCIVAPAKHGRRPDLLASTMCVRSDRHGDYEIQPAGRAGFFNVTQADYTHTPPCMTRQARPSPHPFENPPPSLEHLREVRVQVLYTRETLESVARAMDGSDDRSPEEVLYGSLDVHCAYARDALLRSGTRVLLAWAPFRSIVDERAEDGTLQQICEQLHNPADGRMDAAHVLRGAADLVSLAVAKRHMGGGYGLIPQVLSAAGLDCRDAFSVFSFWHAGDGSLAHELGHSFGCCHALDDDASGTGRDGPPEVCGNLPAWRHGLGFGWTWNAAQRQWDRLSTVMARQGKRVGYFSNPSLRYPLRDDTGRVQEVPLGNATADNARVVREMAEFVTAFGPCAR